MGAASGVRRLILHRAKRFIAPRKASVFEAIETAGKALQVPLIVYPGTFLELEDREVQPLLSLAESALQTATVALHDYLIAVESRQRAEITQREVRAARASKISEAVFRKTLQLSAPEQRDWHRLEIEKAFHRQSEKDNDEPSWLFHVRERIAADAFALALWDFRSLLAQVQRRQEARTAVEIGLTFFDQELPHLKGVRDSMAHADERAVGRAGNKKINTKAIDIPGSIKAPKGRVFISRCMTSEGYSFTTRNGEIGSVRIDGKTLEAAAETFRKVIEALPWGVRPLIASLLSFR